MGALRQKTVEVGVLHAPAIGFTLDDSFGAFSGSHTATAVDGRVLLDGVLYDELVFDSTHPEASFVLHDVVIGIGFHWERKEDQRFTGSLRLIPAEGALQAINRLPIEDYLVSVIASEMSVNALPEYLKAHAVISRSWLLYQMEHKGASGAGGACVRTDKVWTQWWDRQDHALFDVCADDHCQRYQGITRPAQALPKVRAAVDSTCGQVLMYDRHVCDARFSKCCGGMMEAFETAWESTPHPYLQGRYDGPQTPHPTPDLRNHTQARAWILGRPPAFCATDDPVVLEGVLNSYDRETPSLYRWQVSYTAADLTALVKKRLGVDFGLIRHLIPLERGTSGRVYRLRIEGTACTLELGKELLIRKALSSSHLYSSAFVVEESPQGFTLHGAGWGHGVGFCQIGGAVMASQGYPYAALLQHYYPGSSLETLY